MIWLLSSLLIAAGALVAWPALRRTAALGIERLGELREGSSAAPGGSPEPSDPPGMPEMSEPPVLQPAAVQVLDFITVRCKLRALELGLDIAVPAGQDDPAHEHVVVTALAAIGDPATQRHYFPRRPNLLPELMHSINDETVSVRHLVAIVARDPALVGSLLKVANSSFYRLTPQPVESIERAIVVLGNDGLRSVMAAALMQPIFQISGAGGAPRFPELVWEHAVRAAHAAIAHAALVERANPFAAELLSLISGLAEIVLFRAVLEHCAPAPPRTEVDPLVIASLLDSHSAAFAWHIGADWRLSVEMLTALEEQMSASEPATPLGRSLRFGRYAGALAVLHSNALIDAASVKSSLPPSGLSVSHFEHMLARLLRAHEDPRTAARASSRSAETL